MRSTINSLLACLTAIVILSGCQNHLNDGCATQYPLDYSDSLLWYSPQNPVPDTDVDVFYILPTCVFNYTDSTGATIIFADPYSPTQRADMKPSYQLAEEIFADCRFYAPYYRQITLEQWIAGNDNVERYFPKAMDDISNAFNHYITHCNNGRPFIIAGFSQGAKCTVELLKQMPDSILPQLVAAYVIGYRVTENEISAYRQIKPATAADDIGVTICYNSVADTTSICPLLSPSDICINPVNWTTAAITAFIDSTTTATVDTTHHVVIVSGLDSSAFYSPELCRLFKRGNYHLGELSLYRHHLSTNIRTRIQAFQNIAAR